MQKPKNLLRLFLLGNKVPNAVTKAVYEAVYKFIM
jgi:hypothetical protein